MRKSSLDYSSALALARESRALITPNPGFEYQLRVWHFCGYDVYASDNLINPNLLSRKEKAAYKAWKSNRDEMLGRGEKAVNRARYSSVASLAAAFGKRRVQKNHEGEEVGEGKGEGKVDKEQEQNAWENVEKMEQEWTRRLIASKYPPWEKKENQDDQST